MVPDETGRSLNLIDMRKRREALDLPRPGAAPAHLHAATRPRGSDDDRAAGAQLGIGPMTDREAFGKRGLSLGQAANDATPPGGRPASTRRPGTADSRRRGSGS